MRGRGLALPFMRFGPYLVAASAVSGLTVLLLALGGRPTLALVAVCSTMAALVIFLRPSIGVYLILASIPIESLSNLDFKLLKAAKLALVAFVSLVLLARSLGRRRQGSGRPYSWVFGLLLSSGILATLMATNPTESLLGCLQLVLVCAYYLVFSHSDLPFRFGADFVRCVAWLSAPLAVMAILQSIVGYQGWLGSEQQQLAEMQGVFATLWTSVQRGSATFGSSNAAGLFFCAGMLVSVVHAFTQSRGRLMYSMLGVLSGLGLLATFSRGALLGLCSALLFLLWASGRQASRRRLALVLACLLAGLFLVPKSDLMGLLRIGEGGVEVAGSRMQVWEQGLSIIKEHPLAGVGFYGYQQEAELAQGHAGGPIHPHNGLLKAVAEQGIPGGLVYLIYVVVFFRTSYRSLRLPACAEHYCVFASISCIGAGYFGQELVDAGLTMGGSSLAIGFITLLGIQVSLMHSVEASNSGCGLIRAKVFSNAPTP